MHSLFSALAMLPLSLLASIALLACREPTATTATTATTASSKSTALHISTSEARYAGRFGPDGRVVAPTVRLRVHAENKTSDTWRVKRASIALHANLIGKPAAAHDVPLLLVQDGLVIPPGGALDAEAEVGELLTRIAGAQMKGGAVSMTAALDVEAATLGSNELTLHVFVPEG